MIAQASNDETIDHLETLWETKSLKDEGKYQDINGRLQQLGRKINNFIKAVERDKEGGVNELGENYGAE